MQRRSRRASRTRCCCVRAKAWLAARFAPLFPANYRNLYNPEEAARDILRLRDLDADRPRIVRLAKMSLDGADRRDEELGGVFELRMVRE